MVRVHAGPLDLLPFNGAVAQLGEHLICIQEVAGSIPVSSTTKILFFDNWELMSIHKCESSSAKNAEGGNFIL